MSEAGSSEQQVQLASPMSLRESTPGAWDLLLYWMSGLAEGSWDRFRGVIQELAATDSDLLQLRRDLRVRLSQMGHADFFVETTSRWRVLPPIVAGLLEPSDAAIVTGARSPAMLSKLAHVASRYGVLMTSDDVDHAPQLIRLQGTAS